MYCTHCGKLNPDGARFCIACGAPMATEEGSGQAGDATPATDETRPLFEAQPQTRTARQPSTAAQAQYTAPSSSTTQPQLTPLPPQNSPYTAAYAVTGSHPKKNDRGIVVALCLIGSIALIGIGLFAANVLLPKAPASEPTASDASNADTAQDNGSNAEDGSSSSTGSSDGSASGNSSAGNDGANSGSSDAKSDPSSTSSGFDADVHSNVPGSASNGSSGSGKVVPSAQTGANGYILPDAATHTYTREELASLSSGDIQLAVNELLARHGREFNTPSIRDYFESKSWYRPQYAPQDFDAMPDPLNSTEQANYNLLIELRSGQ